MRRKIGLFTLAVLCGLVVWFFFFPSPTPEMAVRKHLLISLQPVAAFTSQVTPGKTPYDEQYGYLYYVEQDVSRPFVYVNPNSLGWRATSSGSGP